MASVEAVRDVAADKLGTVRAGAAKVAESAKGGVAAAGQSAAAKADDAILAAERALGIGNGRWVVVVLLGEYRQLHVPPAWFMHGPAAAGSVWHCCSAVGVIAVVRCMLRLPR
jgi:hypothetical protein